MIRRFPRQRVRTDSARSIATRHAGHAFIVRPGFSLMELMVVIAVTIVLAGLMFPALAELRESAHRVMSASNLRQIGTGIAMYVNDDRDGRLPYAAQLYQLDGPDAYWEPRELSAANLGHFEGLDGSIVEGWTGLGLLWRDRYIRSEEVFYSPSHRGDHPYERYQYEWHTPTGRKIFTNYHYAGDLDWETGVARNLSRGDRLMLATDSLLSKENLNHEDGMNILRGDISVRFQQHGFDEISDRLPGHMDVTPPPDYIGLWSFIEVLSHN